MIIILNLVGTCKNLKWATCEDPCKCTVSVDVNGKQVLDCDKCKCLFFVGDELYVQLRTLLTLYLHFCVVVPKCFLMKAEMFRARNGLSTRSFGGKPVDTAIVDNDGIYDPVCENSGRFKAIQCNGTDTCWCVNSAGVRRSDKGDKNLKCEPVETK